MTPLLVNFQVQYLVAFIVALIGDLIKLISQSMVTFGNDLITFSGNDTIMARVTTGIFGPDNGLIYWINDKVFYVLSNLPYADIARGLNALINALFGVGP